MLCKFGYTCLALLAAGFCFMVSGTGLVLGPLCLHNGTEGLKWERPLKQVKHGSVRPQIPTYLPTYAKVFFSILQSFFYWTHLNASVWTCYRREKLYLYEPDRWASACEEPRGVVVWNVVLFSVLMAASGLQLIFCAVHILTTILGVICGPSFCKNKVKMFRKSPVLPCLKQC